jgi:galactokinase
MPKTRLIEAFGPGAAFAARAPGRVNLIGDHTDYNGGFVLPAAVDCEIRIAFRPAEDRRVEMASLDFNERADFDLNGLDKGQGSGWVKYPMGVAYVLQQEGHTLRGMRAVVKGTVPIGAGLSSSAAFEVASAMAFCAVSGLKINREKLARICQRAENEFVGMNCGIMDQFASLLGRKGCALFIDCTTLNHELTPLDEERARLVVFDSKVKRQLLNSAYNDRRRECEEAFKILKRHLPDIKTYRDLTVPMFKAYTHDLPEPLVRRARHVTTENGRVAHAVRVLKKGDLIAFGALMDASHESLRNDFEVSCRELDLLVDLARGVAGCFGSRMTGAGFGGCVVSLVRPDVVDEFIPSVKAGYRSATGIEPGVYVFRASEGATVESDPA